MAHIFYASIQAGLYAHTCINTYTSAWMWPTLPSWILTLRETQTFLFRMCECVLFLLSRALCYRGLVLCVVRAEGTHIHAVSSPLCIKPDERRSQDNCWLCQGVCVVQASDDVCNPLCVLVCIIICKNSVLTLSDWQRKQRVGLLIQLNVYVEFFSVKTNTI